MIRIQETFELQLMSCITLPTLHASVAGAVCAIANAGLGHDAELGVKRALIAAVRSHPLNDRFSWREVMKCL